MKGANMEEKKARVIKVLKPKADSVFEEEDTKEKMQELKNLAKISGQIEIDNFKTDLNEFISKIENTAIFCDISEIFKKEMMSFVDVVENILKGIREPGIPEQMYKEERIRMLKALIEKYKK